MNSKEAFLAAIKANEGMIFKIASVYTHTVEDRKDLVQEIIYNLWKSFGTFNQKSALSTWMYRVGLNVAIQHLKISSRRVLTVPFEGEELPVPPTDNNDLEEKMKIFKQHFQHLNLLDKGIVLLYLEDKSYAEIAEIIGISPSNVGTKISRIKEKLKKQITQKSSIWNSTI